MNGQDAPHAPPQTAVVQPVSPDTLATPVYFSVSPLKLILLSVCSFGFYELYWFYANWHLIKNREKLNIRPIWRAIFTILFCYQCFNRIRTTAQSLNPVKSFPAGPLTAVYIVLILTSRFPDPYWLLSFFSVLCLLPVQSAVNQINRTVNPAFRENDRFTPWNIVVVVLGGLVFLLAAVGSFLPPE